MRITFTYYSKVFFMLLLFFSCMRAQAQQEITVSGNVTASDNKETLPGASVVVKRNRVGTTTDVSGNFTIKAVKGDVLEVTFMGYKTNTFIVTGSARINIELQNISSNLDEVVVIGYGTQRKSSITGAISKLKGDKLDEAPVARLDQAIQGKIAGVQVQNLSSEAGSTPKIRIRGVNSINAGADPLVVVDGQPVQDGLAFVNSADVESIEVLKDAASAAIYGSRGASGVILVTTKKGKVDKTRYNFKFSTGVKSSYKLYPMMTTSEYTKMLFDEAALKAQDPSIVTPTGTAIATSQERAAYIIENTVDGGQATDWQRQALRNATVSNILLNASGGSKNLQYYISGGYQNDEGLMYHSEFKRYNFRSRLDAQLSKAVKLSVNINPSYTQRERPSTGFIDFVRFPSYIPVYHNDVTAAFVNQTPQWANIRPGDFAQARHFNGRAYSGTMPDGSFYSTGGNVDPFSTSNNTPKSILETRSITGNEYRGQTSADLTIALLPGLSFKTLGSNYINYTTGVDFAKTNSSADGTPNRGVYTDQLTVDLLSENTLNYNKIINKHNFSAFAGYTYQRTTVRNQQSAGNTFLSDDITTLNNALNVETANTFNYDNVNILLSYLGRINYSYADKYLASVSFRADGSSLFAPGKQWGYFPSASLGWVISEENFLKDVSWLSRLKLRGSYGATGNNRIGNNFIYLDLLGRANYSLGTGTGTSNPGVAIGQFSQLDQNTLGNPNVTWERTFSYNFGLDLSLFNGIVNMTVEAYRSKTERLLQRQSTTGFTGFLYTWNNIGSLQNKGLEVELTTTNLNKKNWRWTTNANIAFTRNKVLELGKESRLSNNGERNEVYINQVGGPLVQYYSYKTDGVWLSQAQIDAAKAAGLTSNLSNLFVPGGLKLVDVNGDNKIDDQDRVVTGNPYPDFTYGITNNINWKGFDLSFTIQGVQGGQLVNGDPNYNETKKYNRNYNTNRWISPMFPGDGKTPAGLAGFNWLLTDYVVESASYQSLREVILGYTLPKEISRRLRLNGLRFYTSIQNLYIHTAKGYRGINVEGRYNTGPYQSALLDGYQRGSFPTPRTFLFGIDFNF